MVNSLQAVHVCGVPSDMGGNSPGARLAPEVLRSQGLVAALQDQGWCVLDRGDIEPPMSPILQKSLAPSFAGTTNLALRIHEQVAWSLQQGARPILLGGDHSVALGSIHAVAAHCRQQGKALHVLWMDAHADFNTPLTSPSGNAHGMPLASLCGLGPKPWVHLAGHPVALHGLQVSLIGVRDVDPEEKRLLDDSGVSVFDMGLIQKEGIDTVMKRVVDAIPQGAHVHLSFDMDVIDPQFAPGVDTAVPAGFSVPMVRTALAAMPMLDSVDWVEFNPQRDVDNKTARLAIELLSCALWAGFQPATTPRLQGAC